MMLRGGERRDVMMVMFWSLGDKWNLNGILNLKILLRVYHLN
jgi:hypothetical protein